VLPVPAPRPIVTVHQPLSAELAAEILDCVKNVLIGRAQSVWVSPERLPDLVVMAILN
jgi:hypothetical protein